ncbi:hypothetical protein [Gryllotalpicola ginsengisoli]|uniref:hypothetical protein n=1 Tax=Gryllotalpicola ginsengisoli TaxID=444608 RepID=UPI0003B4BA37|nr:hypothetical protein [Gryllotalpicola ginsengisoli]
MSDEHPEPREQVDQTLVEVRRHPKYWNFMLLGAVVFAIAGLVVTFAMPYDAQTATYSRGTVLGFTLLIAVAAGLALGAVAALVAERVTRRSIRLVEAEHVTGRPDDVDGPDGHAD